MSATRRPTARSCFEVQFRRRSALFFEYDSFPTVPENHWEGSELTHAMVLAQVLRDAIIDGSLALGEPIQEDFGAVLPVVGPGGTTDIFISYCPRDDSDWGWALQFKDRQGCLGFVFRRRVDPEVVKPVVLAIDRATSEKPEVFREREWVDAATL